MPSLFLNSSTRYLVMHSSKSSPPRRLLPAVASTSITPSPISRMDIEGAAAKVVHHDLLVVLSLSRPYASAAAVGSFMIRLTSRPAILPASFVA